MKKITLIILISVFLVFAILFFGLYKTISGYSVSVEKCSSLSESSADDCWHSLAHPTFNRTYCLKILDNETKEHCLEHIPEVNKDNK